MTKADLIPTGGTELTERIDGLRAGPASAPGASEAKPWDAPNSVREAVARIIDPRPFENWKRMYDYGIAHGDSEEEARSGADHFDRAGINVALSKADTILSLLQEGSSGGWRTIESAPRDGTHILACRAEPAYGPTWGFNQSPPTVVHWWGGPLEQMSAPDAGFYTSVNEMEPERAFPATHWQPLPPPPAQGIEGEGHG